jgi:hypothetical protein
MPRGDHRLPTTQTPTGASAPRDLRASLDRRLRRPLGTRWSSARAPDPRDRATRLDCMEGASATGGNEELLPVGTGHQRDDVVVGGDRGLRPGHGDERWGDGRRDGPVVIAAVVIRDADRGRGEESHSYRRGERRPCPVTGSRAPNEAEGRYDGAQGKHPKAAKSTGPLVNSHQPTSASRSASLTRHAKTAKQTLTASVETARIAPGNQRSADDDIRSSGGPRVGLCCSSESALGRYRTGRIRAAADTPRGSKHGCSFESGRLDWPRACARAGRAAGAPAGQGRRPEWQDEAGASRPADRTPPARP